MVSRGSAAPPPRERRMHMRRMLERSGAQVIIEGCLGQRWQRLFPIEVMQPGFTVMSDDTALVTLFVDYEDMTGGRRDIGAVMHMAFSLTKDLQDFFKDGERRVSNAPQMQGVVGRVKMVWQVSGIDSKAFLPKEEDKEEEETPLYQHDCTRCTFLGRFHYAHPAYTREPKEVDLYHCTQGGHVPTVIARYSDEPGDYSSGMPPAGRSGKCDRNDPHYPLSVAYQRAVARGLPIDIIPRASLDR